MPPKMMKRGHVKGAQVTIIGLPTIDVRKSRNIKVIRIKYCLSANYNAVIS